MSQRQCVGDGFDGKRGKLSSLQIQCRDSEKMTFKLPQRTAIVAKEMGHKLHSQFY